MSVANRKKIVEGAEAGLHRAAVGLRGVCAN